MTDERDLDQVRDALHAEATGVEASPSLLDRINAEVSTPAVRPRQRARRLLAVAAAFAVAGGAVALLARDGDGDPQSIETADGGAGSLCSDIPPVFDEDIDLLVYPWGNAGQADLARIEDALADERVATFDALTLEEVLEAYRSYNSRYIVDVASGSIAPLYAVDLGSAADAPAVADELNALSVVRGVVAQCVPIEVPDLPPDGACDPTIDVLVYVDSRDPEALVALRSHLDALPSVLGHRLYFGGPDPNQAGMAEQILHVDVGTEEDKAPVADDLRAQRGVTYSSATYKCRPHGHEIALPEPGPRPTTVALVRDDGWLVSVDLTTGRQVELHDGGDPDDRDPQTGMSYYIDGIEISPDGQWVYFSKCCEPASGQVYRVPTAGPATANPEPHAGGYLPRFSPDGSTLATLVGGQGLAFTTADRQTSEIRQPSILPDWLSVATHDLTWSPDGSMVAVATEDPEDPASHRVHYLAADGDGVTPLDYGAAAGPDHRQFALWSIVDGTSGRTFEPLLREPAELDGLRWLTQDRTYAWLLWVDADGTASFSGTHDPVRTPLEDLPGVGDLPKARLADW